MPCLNIQGTVVMLKLRWSRINWWILLIFSPQLLSPQIFPEDQILVDYLIYEMEASSHETFEWIGKASSFLHAHLNLSSNYLKITVLWDVTLSNLEDRFQCFADIYYLYFQGKCIPKMISAFSTEILYLYIKVYGVITQKTVTFIVTAMKALFVIQFYLLWLGYNTE